MLEDSSGGYETAAEMNSRNRRADAVRDVIRDVTPLKSQFLTYRLLSFLFRHARSDTLCARSAVSIWSGAFCLYVYPGLKLSSRAATRCDAHVRFSL